MQCTIRVPRGEAKQNCTERIDSTFPFWEFQNGKVSSIRAVSKVARTIREEGEGGGGGTQHHDNKYEK